MDDHRNGDAAGDERKQWCIGEHDAGAMKQVGTVISKVESIGMLSAQYNRSYRPRERFGLEGAYLVFGHRSGEIRV